MFSDSVKDRDQSMPQVPLSAEAVNDLRAGASAGDDGNEGAEEAVDGGVVDAIDFVGDFRCLAGLEPSGELFETAFEGLNPLAVGSRLA